MKLENHEIADLFPMMPMDGIQDLAADIHKNGQQNDIVTYEEKILDGRNRYQACQLAGVKPRTIEYTGKDPVGFVVSLNIHRRNLTTGQRATIAAKIANMNRGGDRTSPEQKTNLSNGKSKEKSQAQAAKEMNVSPMSLKAAKKLAKDNPELAVQVEEGSMTLNAAVKKSKEKPKPKKDEVVKGDVDALGVEIPPHPRQYWNRIDEFKEILACLAKAKSLSKAAREKQGAANGKDQLFAGISLQSAMIEITNIQTMFKNAMPYAVCCYCRGKNWKGCRACKERGFHGKREYENVPRELK